MNFKALTLKATIAAAMIAGSTLGASSAQALSMSGKFNFNGSANITQGAGGVYSFDFLTGSSFTPGVADGDILIGAGTDSQFGAALGGIKIKDISTDQVTDLPNFISGLLYNGNAISFTLTKITSASIQAQLNEGTSFNSFSFTGFFTDGVGQVLGRGAISAQFAEPVLVGATTFSGSFKTTSVPTPALLPGLLALGAGALRKRKAEATEESVSEA